MIRRILDDRKREILFAKPPVRVVSLVPSDTFNVAALGCGAALVGRTDFCDLPPELVGTIPSVGGTKNPRVDDVCALAPDLVLANQEENTRKDLEAIVARGFRVYVGFPKRVADGVSHLARLARIFQVEADPDARDLVRRAYEVAREAETRAGEGGTGSMGVPRARPLRAFCPIWMDPLMTIHATTFVSDVLALAGAENVFADRERRYPLGADLGQRPPLSREALDAVPGRDTRYPRVTLDEVIARAPEAVLLPDEPHRFDARDAEVFRALPIPAARRDGIVAVAGKDLCWPGAWIIEGLPRVRKLVAELRAKTSS